MKLQQAMPYKTEQIAMSKTIFQSMINNLGNRIRKMNFQLHFKTQSEKATFINSMQRQKEREQNQIELAASDQQEQSELHSNSYIKSTTNLDLDCIVIEETFEKSILLREKFMDKFRQIGKRLSVTFMVVPNKVKISGVIRDRVDQAQDQYRIIQQDIYLQPIEKYGREIYQSKYFKNYLKEHKVEIIQILRKYYYWFMISETKPRQVLDQVFSSAAHVLYPLHRLNKNERQPIASGKSSYVLGQNDFTKPSDKDTDKLYINVRSRIFEEVISKKINLLQDRQDRQVELSQDRKGLILHMDAIQQIQIQRSTIEQEYNKYGYVILLFNQRVEMDKVANFFANFKFNILVIWEILSNYVCLSFVPPQVSSKQDINPLVQIINQLPKQLLDFKLGFFDNFQLPQQDSQWNFLTIDRDHYEKITLVGVKSMLKKNVEKLIALYIQNKLSSDYLNKVKEQKSNATNNSQIPEVSMDLSRPINESTQFLMHQLDNSVRQNQHNISTNFKKNNQILTSQITNAINFRYENYSIYFNQSKQENQKKYATEDISKIQKSKIPYKNQEYQKIMSNSTSFKYKFYRVKIPKECNNNMQKQVEQILNEKPDLHYLNRWITVFSKQSEELYQPNKKVKTVKIEKSYKIKEGYLLNTNALFIYVQENEELPYGRYEVVCSIKKME